MHLTFARIANNLTLRPLIFQRFIQTTSANMVKVSGIIIYVA